jgi:cell cycle serine/threonine-protein kinase CDC5/MSD2
MLQDPRRHPLSSAAVNVPGEPVSKQAQKAAADPPLPRQNTKTTPPSPPQVIKDTGRSTQYLRIGLLGEVCTPFWSQ